MNPTGLVVTSGVGAGVVGGVLFGFSTFVMRAFDDLPPDEAIRTMQTVNLRAPNPLFMGVMFGTALTALGAGALAAAHLERSGARWTIAGAAGYLASTAITVAYHVPRNERLARVHAETVDAASVWHSYSGPWTAANHLRSALAIGAAICFALALRSP